MTERTAYDRHMDELALRVSHVFDGEQWFDVMSVCTAIIGYSLRDVREDERERAIGKLNEMIREILSR